MSTSAITPLADKLNKACWSGTTSPVALILFVLETGIDTGEAVPSVVVLQAARITNILRATSMKHGVILFLFPEYGISAVNIRDCKPLSRKHDEVIFDL
jgi:hypothetical protein